MLQLKPVAGRLNEADLAETDRLLVTAPPASPVTTSETVVP